MMLFFYLLSFIKIKALRTDEEFNAHPICSLKSNFKNV
jgi:hypothetical protein